jgi:hypothetical protein
VSADGGALWLQVVTSHLKHTCVVSVSLHCLQREEWQHVLEEKRKQHTKSVKLADKVGESNAGPCRTCCV